MCALCTNIAVEDQESYKRTPYPSQTQMAFLRGIMGHIYQIAEFSQVCPGTKKLD